MTLLARVHVLLDGQGVAHALIGAAALAAHGVGRSTLDLDLLTTDPRVLDAAAWRALETEGSRVEIRRGDADDPLAGVIRVEHDEERPVDVVVGRAAWQEDALRRAQPTHLADVDLPVVLAADLVLLKLYAGGPQDRWDIVQLLAGGDRDAIVATVDATVPQLPERCRMLWGEIRGA